MMASKPPVRFYVTAQARGRVSIPDMFRVPFDIIVASAIVTFSWAGNPPDVQAMPPQSPFLRRVALSDAERTALGPLIEESCVERDVQVIVVGVTDSGRYDVISVPGEGCNLHRFFAGAGGQGTILPAIN